MEGVDQANTKMKGKKKEVLLNHSFRVCSARLSRFLYLSTLSSLPYKRK